MNVVSHHAVPTVAGAHGTLLSGRPGDDSSRAGFAHLLQVGAAIEHSLLAQYLYSAYSIDALLGVVDGADGWQDQILIVAREEMGHLMSVQNALRLIGAAPNWKREDVPWDGPYYPFPMVFEPFTFAALEKYVYAEMDPEIDRVPPPGRTHRTVDREWESTRVAIYEAVRAQVGPDVQPHHVGALFRTIFECLDDPALVDDRWFEPETYGQQASWDAWGKGYRPHPADAELDDPAQPPNVIVAQMATRTEMLAGLRLIAQQGEAPHLRDPRTATPSHFDRFLRVYHEIRERDVQAAIGDRMRTLPTNPTADPRFEGEDHAGATSDGAPDQLARQFIEHPGSRRLAELSDLRYRLLITNLGHAHRVAASPDPRVRRTGGYLLQRAFADMFNVKSLAGLLFRSPLTTVAGDPRRAGPPFALPDRLGLSAPGEGEVWELQLQLTERSLALSRALLDGSGPEGCERYVATLCQLDENDAARIRTILESGPYDGGGS